MNELVEKQLESLNSILMSKQCLGKVDKIVLGKYQEAILTFFSEHQENEALLLEFIRYIPNAACFIETNEQPFFDKIIDAISKKEKEYADRFNFKTFYKVHANNLSDKWIEMHKSLIKKEHVFKLKTANQQGVDLFFENCIETLSPLECMDFYFLLSMKSVVNESTEKEEDIYYIDRGFVESVLPVLENDFFEKYKKEFVENRFILLNRNIRTEEKEYKFEKAFLNKLNKQFQITYLNQFGSLKRDRNVVLMHGTENAFDAHAFSPYNLACLLNNFGEYLNEVEFTYYGEKFFHIIKDQHVSVKNLNPESFARLDEMAVNESVFNYAHLPLESRIKLVDKIDFSEHRSLLKYHPKQYDCDRAFIVESLFSSAIKIVDLDQYFFVGENKLTEDELVYIISGNIKSFSNLKKAAPNLFTDELKDRLIEQLDLGLLDNSLSCHVDIQARRNYLSQWLSDAYSINKKIDQAKLSLENGESMSSVITNIVYLKNDKWSKQYSRFILSYLFD